MTTISARQFDRFLHASRVLLPAPSEWAQLTTYPGSLAECVIDAIWSERVRYSTVREIVDRYRAFRRAQGADADHDGPRELARTFDMGIDEWMERIGNRQRVYSRENAPHKAQLVQDAAFAAIAAGVESAEQLRSGFAQHSSQVEELRRRWLDLPSQHSGLTWERLLLVAGVETAPADPWLQEFAAQTTGASLTSADTIALVEAAAKVMGVTALRLRNAIWQYQNKVDEERHTSPVGSNRVAAGAVANESFR